MSKKLMGCLDTAISEALRIHATNVANNSLRIRQIRTEDAGFWASIVRDEQSLVLEISTGLEARIEEFWFSYPWHSAEEKPSESADDEIVSNRTQTSSVWLLLHELSHFDLGHFEFSSEFGIAQRSRSEAYTLDIIHYDLRHLAPLCLEMQADHEATDLLLGAYSTDGWQELREKVLAISGMMMLIELEDAKNNFEGRTHPKAATRIFQLLGHLAEMPLLQAQVRHDVALIPSEEELQAFAHDVAIPCFFDAVHLAQSTSAVSIVNDLGSSEDYFKDLEIAKLGDPSRYADLNTQGAQEWAKLWPCNKALKPILGVHFTN